MTNKLTIPAGTLKKGQLVKIKLTMSLIETTVTIAPITLLSTKEQFINWIYGNYSVYDDNLVDLMQNGDIQLKFLDEYGLPEDTEL